jgi:hypothetical protein
MKHGIFLSEPDVRLLAKLLAQASMEHLSTEERERFCVIAKAVANSAPPKPVGLDENIGSCEPSPLIRWDRTQGTWHTDTRAGRYSVCRVRPRGPFGAYLSGNPITSVSPSLNIDVVKREVERCIRAARDIAQARGLK